MDKLLYPSIHASIASTTWCLQLMPQVCTCNVTVLFKLISG